MSRVATHAGVAQGTFYNHFDSLESALDGVGLLLFAEHARLIDAITTDTDDPAAVFALSTRQTLRITSDHPGYGQLLFDSGLPVDRFLGGLRHRLARDISTGVAQGRFRVDNSPLTVSLVTGGILGLALDLHRGTVSVDAIDHATAALLVFLGIPRTRATRVASSPVDFLDPAPLPLSGLVNNSPIRRDQTA